MPRQRNARGEGIKLRDDLLAGAQRILERTGSEEDVSLRAVAREVGVSAPSIYAHFPDGRAIIDALVHQTFEDLSTVLRKARDDADPGDRVYAICLAYIRFGLEQPVRYLTLFDRRRSPERTKQLAGQRKEFIYTKGAETFAVLADALAESRGEPTESANTEAALLWAALHGYVTLRTRMPQFPWFTDEEQACRAMVGKATAAV